MKWATAISTDDNFLTAVRETSAELRRELGEATADLVLAFVSHHHRAVWDQLPRLLDREHSGAVRLGCSAGATIGGGREIEETPSLALTAASLPGVDLHPFVMDTNRAPAGQEAVDEWRRLVDVPADSQPVLIVLPEPFSVDVETVISALDAAYPGGTVVGGLASGARQAGSNALFAGDDVLSSGLVGVALTGNIRAETVVAQGCRPIGTPLFITEVEGGLVTGLDGERPATVLHDLFERLSERDQELLRYSLFLGVGVAPGHQSSGTGDFLIRNIAGLDPESGALAVAAFVEPGQVVQFHLRDAEASAADLYQHLDRYVRRTRADGPPAGGLLFSCLGRGAQLYGRPDHDSEAFRVRVGPVPLTGFFCNGEIGPVHGATHLHGYTSAFALFRPRSE